MSDARENAICSCICIYPISEENKSNTVSSLHRLCIASTSCNRSNIATKKLKIYENQRTNGPVNAHLISGPSISTKHTNLDKMAEQTLTLITHNPSFTHTACYTNQIPGHGIQ